MSTKPRSAVSASSAVAAPDQSQQALDALFDLFHALRSGMGEAMRDAGEGLAPMHLRMLAHVLKHPGASQQALVQSSRRDKGQIARLVKDLDARGLLVREVDPQDGRSQRLFITPAGRAACQRFRQHQSALAKRVFEPMVAAELQDFVDQIGRLRERLRSLEPQGLAATRGREAAGA